MPFHPVGSDRSKSKPPRDAAGNPTALPLDLSMIRKLLNLEWLDREFHPNATCKKNMKPNRKTAEHRQPNPPEKPDSMAGIRPYHTQTYRVPHLQPVHSNPWEEKFPVCIAKIIPYVVMKRHYQPHRSF